MGKKFLLKDILFNKEKVEKISKEIKSVFPDFKRYSFEKDCIEAFPNLELKQRIKHVADMLLGYLPDDFPTSVSILLKALPVPNDETLTDNDFGDFIYTPYSDFVTRVFTEKDLQLSLNAIKEITKRFSAEYAIRVFLNKYPQESLAFLLDCSQDANYHVRRLASEGTRPKLPWAPKINIDINSAIPILDELFNDKTRYVTRSVANHLHDISKINPDIVFDILSKWKNSNLQTRNEMNFILKHSLRTLVKKGNPQALIFLGINPDVKAEITNFKMAKPNISEGEFLSFSFEIKAEKKNKIFLNYQITFPSKNESKNRKKIFFLKSLQIKQDSVTIKKNHLIKSFSTFILYKGECTLEIFVSGRSFFKEIFTII